MSNWERQAFPLFWWPFIDYSSSVKIMRCIIVVAWCHEQSISASCQFGTKKIAGSTHTCMTKGYTCAIIPVKALIPFWSGICWTSAVPFEVRQLLLHKRAQIWDTRFSWTRLSGLDIPCPYFHNFLGELNWPILPIFFECTGNASHIDTRWGVVCFYWAGFHLRRNLKRSLKNWKRIWSSKHIKSVVSLKPRGGKQESSRIKQTEAAHRVRSASQMPFWTVIVFRTYVVQMLLSEQSKNKSRIHIERSRRKVTVHKAVCCVTGAHSLGRFSRRIQISKIESKIGSLWKNNHNIWQIL